MDDSAKDVLLCVPEELGSTTETFLGLIVEQYEGGVDHPDLDQFLVVVGDAGLAGAVEPFRDAVRAGGMESDWPDVAQQLASEGSGSALLAALELVRGERAEAEQQARDEAERAAVPAAWEKFCADNKDFWTAWTGQDWDAWCESLRQRLPATPAGLAVEFNTQFGYIGSLPSATAQFERLNALGFTVNANQAGPTKDQRLKGAGAQFAYLWADFDGTRESWIQSRDWTYRAANDVDPSLYAVLYEQFELLGEQPMTERIAQLNEWNFNLSATGEEDEAATYVAMGAMFDEEAVAASKQTLEDAVLASAAVPDDEAELIAETYDEIVAGNSEFGGYRLTKDEADEIIRRLAQEGTQ